jgi:DNA-binding GntR family transcriptional regulator
MPVQRPSKTRRQKEHFAVSRPAQAENVISPRADANGPRFSRTAWLAEILRQRILSGVYRPGERIREVQLRAEFGFSNGPIREALQTIVADGLAERAPWHGVRIKDLTPKQIVELFQVRLALLEYAADLAARNMTPALVASADELKRSLDEGFSKIETATHPSFNGRLSQWLLASTGNQAMREIWDRTMSQTLVHVNASLRKSRGSKSKALIFRLIDRICEGEADMARATARELTMQTLADLGIEGKL